MKKIAIIGWGNQAKAWALNLRDSGVEVYIGLRANSTSIKKTEDLGFKSFLLEDIKNLEIEDIALLIPDDAHTSFLQNIKLNTGVRLYYAHGYSLLYDGVSKDYPNYEHILFAPKAIATELRFHYETKQNLGAVYSLAFAPHTNKEKVQKLADALGITYLISGNVKEETNADLFSEQSILCTLLPFGAASAFKKLVEKGYNEEIAFMETWVEVKLIASTLIKMGPKKFFDLISPNALFGAHKSLKIFFDNIYDQKLENIFNEIDSGVFSEQIKDLDLNKIREEMSSIWKDHPLQITFEKMKEKVL